MKQVFALLILLATFAIAQTDSTDILITIRQDGDTTQVGRWRAGMPVLIRDSWDGWGEREKQGNKFVIVRVGIAKARIDSFLVNHTDSTSGLRRKYQLSRAAIQFLKNNQDANNVVRVTPAQLRNAFKRANRLRRFGEPQRMSIIPDRLYIRWRNMLIGATATFATVNTDGGGNYTSLAAAEAGEQKDLVTANEVLTIICSGKTADVTAVTFAGWTTDATRNIVVIGDGDYKLSVSSGMAFYVSSQYVDFYNFEFVAQDNYAFRGSQSNTKFINCILSRNSAGYVAGFNLLGNAVFANTILYNTNVNTNTDYSFIFLQQSATFFLTFYNCTLNAAENSGTGISTCFKNIDLIKRIRAKNTIVQNFDIAFSAESITDDSDYNISDDATAPGANSLNNTTVNFADAANGDFRLLAGSSGIDQGVDLSADPNYAFNTDIIGTVRPQGSAWDIGAFEYVQPATNTDKKNRYKGFGRGFNGGWKKSF